MLDSIHKALNFVDRQEVVMATTVVVPVIIVVVELTSHQARQVMDQEVDLVEDQLYNESFQYSVRINDI